MRRADRNHMTTEGHCRVAAQPAASIRCTAQGRLGCARFHINVLPRLFEAERGRSRCDGKSCAGTRSAHAGDDKARAGDEKFSRRYQQAAFQPWGNGISGQASWLSLAAFGDGLKVEGWATESSSGTGAMAVRTASSKRSNSASLIVRSPGSRAHDLKTFLFSG